jgi:Mg2+ and Co2+ transporter CorA
MKKCNIQIECDQCPCCNKSSCPCAKNKPDVETRIYNFLNTVEKISVKLAQINQILKKAKKKKKKKFKKLGKIDKKTGTLILKGQKKQKAAKLHKRYKAKKK